MRLVLQLQRTTDSGQRIGEAAYTAIDLPHGCGLDAATDEIEKAAELFKRGALELYRANTEGREPVLSGV